MSINSCLATVGSLDGMAVTTVEGIGNSEAGMHGVQSARPEIIHPFASLTSDAVHLLDLQWRHNNTLELPRCQRGAPATTCEPGDIPGMQIPSKRGIK